MRSFVRCYIFIVSTISSRDGSSGKCEERVGIREAIEAGCIRCVCKFDLLSVGQ